MNLEERRRIEELLNRGHGITIKGIALALKRSHSAISEEIRKNGGIRLYNAEQAQIKSDLDKKESNKDKNSPLQHLRNRVTELELRLEKIENIMKL